MKRRPFILLAPSGLLTLSACGVLGLLLILLSACGTGRPRLQPSTATLSTPTRMITEIATSLPTVTPSATPLPTQTQTATATATQPPEPQPTPTSTPTQAPHSTPTPVAPPAYTPEPSPPPTATPAYASLILLPELAPDEVELDVVEQIGGHCLALAGEQDKVYLGVGPRLVVLDARVLNARVLAPSATLSQATSLGQSEVLPGLVYDVALARHLAYIAVGKAGLIVLDVTDPSDMRTIGRASMLGDTRRVVVEPERGLAYMSGGAWQGGGAEMLVIVDISEPEMPVPAAFVELPGATHDVALMEHTAYVLYADGLLALDVSDPAAPLEVARLDLPQGARDMAVAGGAAGAGGHAYVAGQGLQVIDLSDPARPRQVGYFDAHFPAEAVTVSGDLAYLSETFCEWGHCRSTVHIVDLSDRSRPQEVGLWETASAVMDLWVREGTLYLASWQKGLQAVDVRDPAHPDLLGEIATLPGVEDVVVSAGFPSAGFPSAGLAYVSDGTQSGLQVLELDESSPPRLRGVAEAARWAAGYAIANGYAYVPVWADGFQILDVRDPDEPREVAEVNLGMAEQAAAVGERAYVTIGYQGLAVLDVADPAAPRVLGELELGGLAEGLAVAGERAYVTVEGDETSTLHVIDVADPAHPGEIDRVVLQGQARNVALDGEASYAYVAIADCTYYLGAVECSGGLQVVDVRDPLQPRTVLWIEMPGGASDVAVAGGTAYVAAGSGGVWVLDVADPENLRALGWRDTAGRARRVALAEDRVYVADEWGGLLILRAVR